MSVRQQIELTLQVGQDATLDEKVFDGKISLLVDSAQHAESGVYTLEALELNADIKFGDVAEASLIWIEADGELDVSIGGTPGTVATLLGGAGSFPTNFVGGEVTAFEFDSVAVAVTFTSGDQSAQQCANRINAAAMIAGLDYVPVVVESGRLRLRGKLATADGEVKVTTANATLGFPATTSANGTNASGSAAPQTLKKVASSGGETSFYVAAVKTTSCVISNRESRITTVRVCIVGDIAA